MKKQRGITLISLVVTIIILIILAGVSINIILGKDGIINKAKEAKENIELAQIEEQEQLNELYGQMSGESSGSISYDAIEKLTEFKKALADYIEGKNVDRPETAGDASVYINSFEKVLLAEQNKHSEFKSKVAEAITEMGVETTEDADANTMANNIRNISNNKECASFRMVYEYGMGRHIAQINNYDERVVNVTDNIITFKKGGTLLIDYGIHCDNGKDFVGYCLNGTDVDIGQSVGIHEISLEINSGDTLYLLSSNTHDNRRTTYFGTLSFI